MKSKTKRVLDFHTIEAITQRAFGLRACVVQAQETSDGFFSTVWRILVDPSGQAARPGAKPSPQSRLCYLKVAPPPSVPVMRYEKNLLAAEYQTLQAMAAAGLPVPEILYFDAESGIVDSPWMFTSAVPGVAWRYVREQSSDADKAAMDAEIGRLSAGISKIRGAWFGPVGLGAGKHRDWPSAVETMFEMLFEDAVESGSDIGVDPPEIRGFLAAARPSLETVRVPQLVHWDLWEGNVFVRERQAGDSGLRYEVSGIIDCERALWGDPLMEFGFRGFVRNQTFLNAYGAARNGAPYPIDGNAEIRCSLYDLYLFLVLLIEPRFRAYETEGPEVWARHQLTALVPKLRSILNG